MMTPDDKTAFGTLLTSMAELYGKKLSQPLIQLYWAALKTYPFLDVRAAFERHVLSPDAGQFMPKPADIVRALVGSTQTQALSAWTKVLEAARSVGAGATVVFDDPIIHAVITDMGGWVQLCHTDEKNMPFRAQEFEKRYQGYALHPPKTCIKKLIGMEEHHNQLQGFAVQAPVLIGDVQKARLIYQNGVDARLRYQPLRIEELTHDYP